MSLNVHTWDFDAGPSEHHSQQDQAHSFALPVAPDLQFDMGSRVSGFLEAPPDNMVEHPAQSTTPSQGLILKAHEGTIQTNAIGQTTAILTKDKQDNTYLNDLVTSPTIGFATEVKQLSILPPSSTTFKQAEEPPRNAEGRAICQETGCNNLAFTTISDWR
jgi:hypothetical protein